MNIVWATRFVPYPPLRSGDYIYSARLIESLAPYATVDVVCFESGAQPSSSVGMRWHILPWAERPRWQSLYHRLPNIGFQFNRPAYVHVLEEVSKRADAVVVDHIGMAWCIDRLGSRRTRRLGPVTIVLTHNYDAALRREMATYSSSPLMRTALRWDAWKAARTEARSVDGADGTTANTEADRQALLHDHPKSPVLVVEPGYAGSVVAQRTIDANVPARACVLANQSCFHKKVVFTETMRAFRHHPFGCSVTIDVVGQVDEKTRAQFATDRSGVNVCGFVDDLPRYLRSVRVGIMTDVVGGGFKHRALTLIFNRVPIMAVRGALAGMGLTAGVHYLEYADLNSLVAAIADVVVDLDGLNLLQNRAFASCEGRYRWEDRGKSLVAFARDLMLRV